MRVGGPAACPVPRAPRRFSTCCAGAAGEVRDIRLSGGEAGEGAGRQGAERARSRTNRFRRVPVRGGGGRNPRATPPARTPPASSLVFRTAGLSGQVLNSSSRHPTEIISHAASWLCCRFASLMSWFSPGVAGALQAPFPQAAQAVAMRAAADYRIPAVGRLERGEGGGARP